MKRWSIVLMLTAILASGCGPSDAEQLASDIRLAEQYELKERNARFACAEWGSAKACGEIDDNAALARYYRQRVSEAVGR